MKKWSILILVSLALSLTACGDEDKGGGATAKTPKKDPPRPSCSNYYYNGSHYIDANGNRVNCVERNDNNGWQNAGWDKNSCINFRYHPDGHFVDHTGKRVNCNREIFDFQQVYPFVGWWGSYYDCSYWNTGSLHFYGVNMYGVYVCVQSTVINQWNPWYSPYPTNPIDACRVGVDDCDCGSAFGGTLSWGFCH